MPVTEAERSTTTKRQYTIEEWQAEAARRFGPVEQGNWSFVCPICGHVQSPASIKAEGYGDPNRAYSECCGRGTRDDKHLAHSQGKQLGEKADCDWKAYGLFSGPVTVTLPDGSTVHTFDFAPEEATPDAGHQG